MTRSVYTVRGMRCGHCAASVTAEMGALDGVREVEVDVAAGQVTVTSAVPLPSDRVAAVVSGLGYELVR
jgi:copper chaperone CopZ